MMKASRTPACRLLQYHSPDLRFDGAAALRKQIVAFVKGVRGPRRHAVTQKQIVDWFRGTDADFVRARLTEVCGDQVRICRTSLGGSRERHDAGYVYESTENVA